ncbi:helix-turn-helix domain-containing protein [Halalkalibacter flavus]|uniref:helix-turn-helix domain-containing protein n=1 Tax=Halalkalibacter flavus TaxID=3090668 RepID=UPI002FCC0D7B
MFFGLGRRGSKFGRFLDKHGIKQKDLAQHSGISKSTISRLVQGDSFHPSMKNGKRIIKTLRDVFKKDVDYDDFWSV